VLIGKNGKIEKCIKIEDSKQLPDALLSEDEILFNEKLCTHLSEISFVVDSSSEMPNLLKTSINLEWIKDQGVFIRSNDTTASFDANGNPFLR
jgi:hypothetical protein